MRHLTLDILFIFALGCATTKKPSTVSNILNGTWLPIRQEIGGKELPVSAFEKQKLLIPDSTYTFMAESINKGVVKYNGDKMNIYRREGVNAGRHFTTIYNHEPGQLTICYNLAGDCYPEAFDTKSKPLFFLSVFKKEPENNPVFKARPFIPD